MTEPHVYGKPYTAYFLGRNSVGPKGSLMPFSLSKVWIVCMVMGIVPALLAPRSAASATTGKRTASPATKDRETHRLLTESPPDWAQLLLSQGSNVEARNLHHETPLITSAGQGNLPLVEVLLQNHADIHAADAEGNTPLHVASFNGRVKVVELLLNNGAKTRVQNTLGFSPLHQAVRRFWEIPGETEAGRIENQRQIILLLLAHDADPALEDFLHRTAPVLATESNNATLADLFDARSMSSKQATAPPPVPSNLPLHPSPIDIPPPNEPEVRQQVESTTTPETQPEADSGKTDTPAAEPQPIPPPSGPEAGTLRPPDTNPTETLPLPKPSQPSVTAPGVPETPTESAAKPVPPSTSAADARPHEPTTQPVSPASPPEKPQAAAPAVPDREQPRPSPPTMPQESAPAESAGSERHQTPRLSLQTPPPPPEASPPASSTRPAQRSESGIPHTKAMPDLPKQRSTHAPQAPEAPEAHHTMDQPAPEVQKSDPLHASPPAATLPPPKRPDESGALAQAAHPVEPIPRSGQDIPPSQPDPVPSYPVKEPNQVEVRNGHRDRDQAPAKDSSDNWIFRNLGFGLGVGWTHNLGPERIESATAVNGVVRVDADQNDLIRFMPEVHLWIDQWWDDQRWNWGPFFSLAPGANFIDAVGFGLMLGYRPHPADRYTFNLGIGGTLDFNTRVLGDGLTANQPLPSGENQVRTKQTTATGLLIMFSVGWDIGMPRRSPPPQPTP